MNPIEKSRQIKIEADRLLKDEGIEALMLEHGEVIYTGSYALDLMVWTDIDLYVIPKLGITWDECAAQLAAGFLRRPDVDRVKVEKSFWKTRPDLPKGIGFGVKIPGPNHALPWKLDIWIVDDEVRSQNRVLMDAIRSKLTPKSREIIILAKTALITNGRTPSMSGVLVYEAVLYKGLTTTDEIINYVLSRSL